MAAEHSIPRPTILSIPDDVLLCILQRLLPSRGLSITPAALSHRRAYLQHIYAPDMVLPLDACDVAWRSCLTDTDAIKTLPDLPPWRRGKEADLLYTAAAADAAPVPVSLVCKRWRQLVAQAQVVKVAVCDVGEVPPSSTQVLVLASPASWRTKASSAAAASKLAYLKGLASLRTLVVWCAAYSDQGKHRRLRFLTAPTVPRGLDQLRHLIYVRTPRYDVTAALSDTMANGIASLTNLVTLSLPQLAARSNSVSQKLLGAPLRQLRMLDAPLCVDAAQCCNAFTQLRSLRVRLPGSDLDAPMITHELAALAHISSSLHELCLDCEDVCEVTGLEKLVHLSHLDLSNVHVRDTSGVLSALTGLVTLRCSRECAEDMGEHDWDSELFKALKALPSPPRLSLAVPHGESFSGFEGLTTLEELRAHFKPNAATGHDIENVGVLSALTRITELCLLRCDFDDEEAREFCRALGCLSMLRSLQLSACKVPMPEALRSLTALQDLSLDGDCLVGEAGAWLGAMRLPETCPGLRRLELHRLEAVPDILRLSQLEELILFRCSGAVTLLARLACLKELRALHVDGRCSVNEAHLEPLLDSEKLQFLSVSGISIPVDSIIRGALEARGILVFDMHYFW